MVFQYGFTSIFLIMSKDNTFSCLEPFLYLFLWIICGFVLFSSRILKLELWALYLWYLSWIFSPSFIASGFWVTARKSLSTLRLKWCSLMFSSGTYVLSFSWLWCLFSSPLFFSSEDSWRFCQVKKVNKIILFRNFGGVYQESFRGLNPPCCWKYK